MLTRGRVFVKGLTSSGVRKDWSFWLKGAMSGRTPESSNRSGLSHEPGANEDKLLRGSPSAADDVEPTGRLRDRCVEHVRPDDRGRWHLHYGDQERRHQGAVLSQLVGSPKVDQEAEKGELVASTMGAPHRLEVPELL